MGAFSLTNAAKSDLRNIAKFTERRWGREQRQLYLKGMDDAFHRLADSPTLGVSCGHIASDLRKHPFQSHMIYYDTVSATHISIVRVLHKRMDVSRVPSGK
ncbi:MAG: type II toxin-antitoxin system RelE/ParE family toxin [Thiohalocapsa sp.]|nr:type II toxin-antitoxin system RelE/ParE family toxin [Thiohalocapsa sp.]MCF7992661.1 type II toxin-antitoxin system RelE/ParE family toxin [Thiohalocapsa sp.]